MREGQFTACATCALALLELIGQNYCPGDPKGHIKPKLSWNLLNYDAHSPVGSLWDLDTVIYKQKSVPQFLPTSQVL